MRLAADFLGGLGGNDTQLGLGASQGCLKLQPAGKTYFFVENFYEFRSGKKIGLNLNLWKGKWFSPMVRKR